MNYLFEKGYAPLGKSWMIRMGFLDVTRIKSRDTIDFLVNQNNLGEDLQALVRVSESILNGSTTLDVGESGTVRRFFQFYSWKNKKDYEFVEHKTLKTRAIWNNPEIVNYPLEKMRSPNIDKGTTQWQSAAILCGSDEILERIEPEVRMSYDAVDHWKDKRMVGERWDPRADEVILEQAKTFLKLLNGEKVRYEPKISEGYCFARAFGFMSTNEGMEKWPKLIGHESNRIREMEKCLAQYEDGKIITTNDHRVVQSIAMKGYIYGKMPTFGNRDCVKKTWPTFWKFLRDSEQLAKIPEVFSE